MEYIKNELAKGNSFQTFMLLEDGEPREPVKAISYEGCVQSICRRLSISVGDGESLIWAIVEEAEKHGITDAVTRMFHEHGMHTCFA